MSDTYGVTTLPLAAPAAGKCADPVLDVLGAYLKACINTYAATEWTALAPGRGNPVSTYQTNDPSDNTFNTADLPALYVWRDAKRGRFERIADDWETNISQVHLCWAPTPAVQVNRAAWSSFLAKIAQVIDYALWNGRDPAWVDATDSDVNKTTRGSLVIGLAGLIRDLHLATSEVVPLQILMADGTQTRDYDSIHCIVEVQEKLTATGARMGTLYAAHMHTDVKNSTPTTMDQVEG